MGDLLVIPFCFFCLFVCLFVCFFVVFFWLSALHQKLLCTRKQCQVAKTIKLPDLIIQYQNQTNDNYIQDMLTHWVQTLLLRGFA